MEGIELEGAVVAVTGGARGIGRATGAEFARRGARVWVGDIDAPAAEAAAAAIGSGARGLALDVTSRDSFAAFLGTVADEAGPLDVLVNNAGIMPLGSFLEEDDATSRRTIDVNLWGPILGMRLALPEMVARRQGHVINVASMMGKLHVPGAAVYGASKYGAVGLGLAVRDELEGTGVTLTTVLPSAVKTDLLDGVPLDRWMPTVEPEQVAKAIADSCKGRPAEVYVPGWISAYEPATALVPGRVLGAVRRLIGHDRVLTSLDEKARADYDRRVKGE